MTGTEAISNGVPAFKPPESRNAAITLGIMAAILGVLLRRGHLPGAGARMSPPRTHDTVLSQVGRAVYGNGGFFYYALQIATMAILFLAANTSFADFPRLSSILARDGLMPRQFMNRGDKLAFSNGIIGLAVVAMVVLVIFGAKTHSMIPLYAVGVFVSFTLSQAGMVVHWFRLKTEGWQRRAAMNGVRGGADRRRLGGASWRPSSSQGAYIVLIAGVVLVADLLRTSSGTTRKVARFLEPQSARAARAAGPGRHLQAADDGGAVRLPGQRADGPLALAGPGALSRRLPRGHRRQRPRARAAQLQRTWVEMEIDVPLVVVDSPYREFTRPAVEYVRSLQPGPRAHGDRHHPRVRGGALVGELPPQPERPAAQGRPAGGAVGRGHQHPVPHRRARSRGGQST